MKYADINVLVKGIPYTTERNAEKIYNFIIENKITSILELGFAHGTATCYMAAALDELKRGHITAVDLVDAADEFKPTIHELLERTGLGNYVSVVREKSGYNWFLHDKIKSCTKGYECTPVYDLCIIDGPKNWTIDGGAFFMADKLIKAKGWIIFDDYNWTYFSAEKGGSEITDGIAHRSLSQEEFTTPHIKEVFQLLVMQHPDYTNFKIHGEGDWAWAQKIPGTESKKTTMEYNVTYKDVFSKIFRIGNRVFKFRKV
jgi:predicted O-methyltransferase YrrM